MIVLIEEDFVMSMFQVVESLSDDVNDPYHYSVIRVLVRNTLSNAPGLRH